MHTNVDVAAVAGAAATGRQKLGEQNGVRRPATPAATATAEEEQA